MVLWEALYTRTFSLSRNIGSLGNLDEVVLVHWIRSGWSSREELHAESSVHDAQENAMNKHLLPDCFSVWYNSCLQSDEEFDVVEILCEQGYADFYLNGINKKEAIKARASK